MDNHKSAIEQLLEAIDWDLKRSDKESAYNHYVLLVNEYFENSLYDDLFSVLLKRLDLARSMNDLRRQIDTYGALMNFRVKIWRDSNGALDYANKALELAVKLGDEDQEDHYKDYSESLRKGSLDPIADKVFKDINKMFDDVKKSQDNK